MSTHYLLFVNNLLLNRGCQLWSLWYLLYTDPTYHRSLHITIAISAATGYIAIIRGN